MREAFLEIVEKEPRKINAIIAVQQIAEDILFNLKRNAISSNQALGFARNLITEIAERDVRIVSLAGMEKSALFQSPELALTHAYTQATRALNILNNPNGYTPPTKPLYGISTEP